MKTQLSSRGTLSSRLRLAAIFAFGATALVGITATDVTAAEYRYDNLHRLVRVARSNGTVVNYEYDQLGNRARKSVTVCPDDGNPCTDAGDDGSGNCATTNNTAPCDNGQFCDGSDTCAGGSCSVHAGNPCTGGTECAVACDESTDRCADQSGTACSNDGNPCTTDSCDGAGRCVHPAGNAGAICRVAIGACDPQETCTGSASVCPADGFAASTAVCRAAGGVCDSAETCTGTSGSCPADVFATTTTVCRASGGICDAQETCSGSNATCPADVVAGTATVCRASTGECDLSENCGGSAKDCPADAFVAGGAGCGSDGAVCTNDICNGTSGGCTHPANTAACDDGLFCNGADTCSEGSCNAHTGNPCASGVGCDETTDTCTQCTQLTLPSVQRCVLGRDCTVSIGLEHNGLSVASVASEVVSVPSASCASECSVGAAAANGFCSINPATCSVSVADMAPPITAFTNGEMARVVVQCAQEGSGEICLHERSAGSISGLPVPICSGDVCAPFECTQCLPGDCNQSSTIEAADPICAVLCLIGQAPVQADCAGSADCNCLGGTEASDPICTVLRLIGTFLPDPCVSGTTAAVEAIATSLEVARPLGKAADAGRVVLRLYGGDAGRVGGVRVVLETGVGSDSVRLSRRLAKRGFHLEQTREEGRVGLLITPPWQVPVPSIGAGRMLRIRHCSGEVRVGAVEYGSTEGLPLRSVKEAAAALRGNGATD